MSETVKKKPDFKNLDLSSITRNIPEIPKPAIDLAPDDKKIQEGTWIDGISIQDITPEQFHDWLKRILPAGTKVADWDLQIMSTPAQREKLVIKATDLLYRGFIGMRVTPDVNKGKFNKN